MLKHLLLPLAAAATLLAAGPALASDVVVTARDQPLAATYTPDGSLIGLSRAAAYPPGPTRGDVTGDGRDDLVTASDGVVRVFDGRTLVRSFSPYADHAIIAIAVADVNGDGHADIITAPLSGAPFVKVFSGADGSLLRAFLAGSDKAIIAIAADRAIIAIAVGSEVRVYDSASLALRGAFVPFGGAPLGAVAIA